METNKIYQGDCIEVMKTFPDKSVDLVLTDPPYNFEVVGGAFKSENPSTSRDYLSKIIDNGYGNFNPEEFLSECKRVLKKIRMVVFCNRFLLEKYIQFARENKLIFDVHIMGKNNPAPFKNNTYLSDIEYIMVMRENGTFFNKKSKFDDYRKITMVNVNSRNSHPAQKPIEVIEKYLRVLCDKTDLVLDPFLGSGTTALACKQMGINWIGIEHNEDYIKISKDRLKQEVLSNLSPPVQTSKSKILTSDKPKGFNMGLEVQKSKISSPKLSPTEITSPNPNIKSNFVRGLTRC